MENRIVSVGTYSAIGGEYHYEYNKEDFVKEIEYPWGNGLRKIGNIFFANASLKNVKIVGYCQVVGYSARYGAEKKAAYVVQPQDKNN